MTRRIQNIPAAGQKNPQKLADSRMMIQHAGSSVLCHIRDTTRRYLGNKEAENTSYSQSDRLLPTNLRYEGTADQNNEDWHSILRLLSIFSGDHSNIFFSAFILWECCLFFIYWGCPFLPRRAGRGVLKLRAWQAAVLQSAGCRCQLINWGEVQLDLFTTDKKREISDTGWWEDEQCCNINVTQSTWITLLCSGILNVNASKLYWCIWTVLNPVLVVSDQLICFPFKQW